MRLFVPLLLAVLFFPAGGGIGDEAWAEQVVQPAGDIHFGTAHDGQLQPVAQASSNVKQANR